MALDENQLAVVLQASIERARELLHEDGGFLPFGARAKPSGEIEFVQLAPASEAESLDALFNRLGDMLAAEALRGEILGSALVAHARPAGDGGNAVAVLIETQDFSRSVLVPYRIEQGSVELGEMTPQPAAPAVFAATAGAR